MTVTWADVTARYEPGMALPPLVGSSKLVVDHVDDDQLCVRQRLWRACLTREEFENAARILDEAGDVTPIEFGELLRVHHATTFHVTTDCSRVPNLSATVLRDLGAFGKSPASR
ncbi:hypothetical protein [Pseudonocardia sp.]|uniref:hypothetical protein n=1 Tax=Pseudonocardia sp. TaxID=60912 RepID=UPI003D0ECA74